MKFIYSTLLIFILSLGNAYANNTQVLIETNQGNIQLELFSEQAPITVKNFLNYVRNHRYDGTIFHRVINGFMIQGGGYRPDFTKVQLDPPIRNESYNKLQNTKGSIAMARTSDPDSATSQFFINLVDNPNLNYASPYQIGYAVFGQVSSGMDIVQKIAETPTGTQHYMHDVPINPIVIQHIKIIQ